MATKLKGIYKSFKYISQIFVVKEREFEIGYPTDVKHVAHIGWDGPSGSEPSWMSEFKTAPDFSTSVGYMGDRRDSNTTAVSTLSSQDYEQSLGCHPSADMSQGISSTEIPNIPKKQKRKKIKTTSTSSPRASSTRSSRPSKMKDTYSAREAIPTIQV